MSEERFIEVSITNDLSECTITDYQVLDDTIHGYVDVLVRALEGITFHRNTIYQGLKEWCANFESESVECEAPPKEKFLLRCKDMIVVTTLDEFNKKISVTGKVYDIVFDSKEDWYQVTWGNANRTFTWTLSLAQLEGEPFTIHGFSYIIEKKK